MSRNAGAKSRAEAARRVHAVVADGVSLEQLPVADDFSAADASLVKALTFGTLRHHLHHRALLKLLLSKPLKKKDRILESLLSVGLFQLLESDRPDYAVVSATVDATKILGRPQARGLVNAVLRRFLRERDELLAQVRDSNAAKYALPDWMLDAMKKDWPDSWERIVVAGNKQAPMWLRVNQQQVSAGEYASVLQKAEIGVTQLSGFESGLRLELPLSVGDLPDFRAGHVAVQDGAAQLAAQLLDAQNGDRVLDACAAPGGKTCHILERTPGVASLTALDSSAARLGRVTDNLERLQLNSEKVQVVCGDAATTGGWWDGELYDRILLDAPCSATGVIRRHPDIRHLRRSGDIPALQSLQLRILANLWHTLKPGGTLLYATCSVLKAENSDVIGDFIDTNADVELLADAVSEAMPDAVSAERDHFGVRLLPGGDSDTDGFYYALMRKAPD